MVGFTTDHVIVEQSIEEFISSANEFEAGIQIIYQVKWVQFVDKVEMKNKNWSWMAKARAECVILMGNAFIPLCQKLGFKTPPPGLTKQS